MQGVTAVSKRISLKPQRGRRAARGALAAQSHRTLCARDGQPGDALHWVVHRRPLSGPETRGQCTGHERIAKAKPQVVFAVEYLPLHSFLDYWSSVEQRWEGRERSCVTGH